MLIEPKVGSNNLCETGHLSRPKRSGSCGRSTRAGRRAHPRSVEGLFHRLKSRLSDGNIFQVSTNGGTSAREMRIVCKSLSLTPSEYYLGAILLKCGTNSLNRFNPILTPIEIEPRLAA
jgi:hypothetical protein